MKTVSYKQTLKTVEAYQKALEKGTVIKSSTIEEYQRNISKFLTKKGELKKNLSKKNHEQFNKIVSEFKESKFSKMSELRKVSSKQEKTLMKNQGLDEKSVKTFRRLITEVGSKKLKIDSSIVVQASDEISTDTSESDILKMLEHLSIMKETATTEELRNELMYEDEDFKDIQNIIDITKTMTEAEKTKFLNEIESSNEHWNKAILNLPKVKNVKKNLSASLQTKLERDILNNPTNWKNIVDDYNAKSKTRLEKLKTGSYKTRFDKAENFLNSIEQLKKATKVKK